MAEKKTVEKVPAKRGRKPSETADEYSPLTIRLPNKLRYGLELLARAQHRSLSQAVEWALQVGLNSYEVGSEMEPLGVVLDKAWAEKSEAARLLMIYWSAPALLTFEDFVTCELTDRSRERLSFIEDVPEQELGIDKLPTDSEERRALYQKFKERVAELEDLYSRFVIRLWPAIRAVAVERANLGKPTQSVALLHALGLAGDGLSTPKIMEMVLEYLDKKEATDAELSGPLLKNMADLSAKDIRPKKPKANS